MLKSLLTYIRDRQLLRSGQRLGVAVSGGADSVALLRAMLALRDELGVLVSVVHVHHGIRGAEADADAEFVTALAGQHSLPIHLLHADVPDYAAEHSLSLEAAGRAVRYRYFRELLSLHLDRIATAHTRDDQAETVLLRLIRGAGTRGLAGVYPAVAVDDLEGDGCRIIRPLLDITRAEVEAYLCELGQPWHEDATNADPAFLRNRVRHHLLPLLQSEFNPNIRQVLAQTAEVSRDEEDFWTANVRDILKSGRRSDSSFCVTRFLSLHTALQRRVLRAMAELAGESLGFEAIDRAREAILGGSAGSWPLTGKLLLELRRYRDGAARFQFLPVADEKPSTATSYDYALSIPAQIEVRELGIHVRVESPELAGKALHLRNWRPGDRFHPQGRGSGKKLKELFQIYRIPAADRALLPVLEYNGEIVWVRGLPPAAKSESNGEEGFSILVELSPITRPQ